MILHSFFDGVYGNDAVKELFASRIAENKLSHAYMLVGPDGSGKKTLVHAIASEMARHSGASEAMVERIAGGHSPDVLTIPTEEKRIGIDTVRSFVSTVYLTPNELDFKIYIFDGADRLTPQAQNALLKIIEEPPRSVYIFLLCANPASLLQTVRSRVISVSMQTFTEDEVRRYLASIGENMSDDTQRADFAVRMSAGALGAVKTLMDPENKEYDAYKKAEAAVACLSKKNRSTAYFDMLTLVTGAVKSTEDLALLLKYLIAIYRDVFYAQNSEELELTLIDEETAEHYAALFSVRTVIESLELASNVQKNMNFNVNTGLSAVYLAENLWRIT